MVDPADIAERYTGGLDRLKKEYSKNPSGRALSYQRSDLIDGIVTTLFEKALGELGFSNGSGVKDLALIAVGGYGRRELCPFSDIDLMVLHRIKDKTSMTQIAEKMFYPLWDLGLQVGHGMRTVKESLRMASSNFELQTSFLEARLITGDITLLGQLQEGLIKQLRARGGRRFLENILRENTGRYMQYGQAAYLLEPDLKEGEGGLRDIHAILWAAKGLLGHPSLKDTVKSGYLNKFEAETLEQDHEFLLLVRNHLHYISGRKNDRLFFEYQEEIARALGFKGENGISATEKFMKSFYTHASSIELISRAFWEQLKDDYLRPRRIKLPDQRKTVGGGIAVANGKLSLTSPKAIIEHPGVEVKLFKRAIKEGLHIDYKKLNMIREGLAHAESPARWTEDIRHDLFEIISAGGSALPSIEIMDHLGILGRYIPEWAAVRCLPQYDSYHLYTVDMHLFLTVAELKNIAAGKYDTTNPLLKQVYREIKQKDLLYFAAFFHDIGKGLGKSHSEKGVAIVKKICERMDIQAKDCETIEFLIGNHLLLLDTAMRRDLDEENVIIDLAETIMREDRLRMLYLISVADSIATGPKAWDTWKENLLRELFSKIIHIIKSGEYTSKKSIERIRKTSAEVKAALIPSYPEEEVGLFLDEMPHSYLLAQTSEDMIEHFKQVKSYSDKSIAVHSTRKKGICEMVLIAKDQPGLFNKVSGVLALHGINILGAQVYTRKNGMALDVFKVKGIFEHDISAEKWDEIRRDIKRALDGKISLDYRIAEKADRYKTKGAFKRNPKVEIDNSSSDFYTIVEVHAQDRIGLLYTITKVMHDLNLDIHLAKVSTNVDKVIDVFYVWDIEGQKLSDEEQISDVKRAILLALK